MYNFKILLMVFMAVLVSACATTSNVPKEYMNKYQGRFEKDHIDLIWRSDRTHQEFRSKGLISKQNTITKYLNDIASPFIKLSDSSIDIKVFIFRDPSINAFAMPNGHVYFNEGLIASFENKDQLAFVVGHEIAHVELEHSIKKRRQATNAIAVTHVADVVLSGVGLTGLAYAGGALSITSHSREAERESDLRSIELMCKAGFRANQAGIALDKLANNKRQDRLKGSIWGSHPGIGERITLVKEHAAKQDCSKVATIRDDYKESILPIIINNVIEMKLRRRQYQSAIDYATDAIENNPSQPNYYYLLGEGHRLLALDPEGGARERYVYYGEGKIEEYKSQLADEKENNLAHARSSYAKAKAIDSSYPQSYKGIGLLNKDQGNIKEALDNFNHYLELETDKFQQAYVRAMIKSLTANGEKNDANH